MNYPINLQAEYIQALVIGAGSVALRKIDTLLNQGISSIQVIDKNIEKEDFAYKENPFVTYTKSSYNSSYLENVNLVFIATDDKELNSKIALECKNKGLLCNVITAPEEGSFSLPALVRRDNLLVSLSTAGLSPALSRALKEDIETFLDLGYADFVAFLGKLRPLILELKLESPENTKIFRFLVDKAQRKLFLDYLKDRDEATKAQIYQCIEENFEADIQKIIIHCLESL